MYAASTHFDLIDVFDLPRSSRDHAASTPLANASKLFLNISASFVACASYAAGSFHVFLGVRTSLGTPGTAAGTSKPKTGSFTYFALSSWPESAAVTIARVCASFMREPVP